MRSIFIEKGPNTETMTSRSHNVEELRRLAESDFPVLAFAFDRRGADEWEPKHCHARGQIFTLTRGLLVVDADEERWMFPSHRGAWIPPRCVHSARFVGSACGSMAYLSEEACRGLPDKPCMFSSSELLFAAVHRMRTWNPKQCPDPSQKRLVAVLRDEIRQSGQQPLRLPMPREATMSKVAYALLENVADSRSLDEWGRYAGMARRTFMRAFSAHVGMTFGRWRQQARLFAAVEMLTEGKSVTETALAVGYDSVSAFIEMFRTTLGSAPQEYLRRKQG